MKKPNLKDYSTGTNGMYHYYHDLSAYWQAVATECIEELVGMGEVYKDEWGEYRWKDTGVIVGG